MCFRPCTRMSEDKGRIKAPTRILTSSRILENTRDENNENEDNNNNNSPCIQTSVIQLEANYCTRVAIGYGPPPPVSQKLHASALRERRGTYYSSRIHSVITPDIISESRKTRFGLRMHTSNESLYRIMYIPSTI